MWDWSWWDWMYGQGDWYCRCLEEGLGRVDGSVEDGGELAEGVDVMRVKASERREVGGMLKGCNEVNGGGASSVNGAGG